LVTIPVPLPVPEEKKGEVGLIDDNVSLIGVNKIKEIDSSSTTNDFHPTHTPHPNSFTPPIIN
jgi:hypothetical protein